MHVDITIPSDLLAGAGAGALGLILGLIGPGLMYLPLMVVMAAFGKADLSPRSLRRLAGYLLRYALPGAVVGGALVNVGLPWWVAGLILLGVGLLICVVYAKFGAHRSRY